METARSGRFEELDVLRGAAALCVVLAHYSSHCARYFGAGPLSLHLPVTYAVYAVELFFMISGFVIYFTLERSATWRDFAFSRLTRLYPAYWTALTVMVVLESLIFGEPFWLRGYTVNMTMLQEYLGFNNLDIVFWSLTVEIAFYVTMGLVFATGLLPHFEVVAAGWLALACLLPVAEWHLGFALPTALSRLLILQHVPFFVGGIMFYLLSRKGPTPARFALLLGALAVATLAGDPSDAHSAEKGLPDVLRYLGVTCALFGIFAMAVTGRLRFSVSPIALWLGAISYSLYLSHRNLGYSTLFWLHDAGLPTSITFLITLGAAFVLASAVTYSVERPALRVLRRWYRARSSSSEPLN